MKNNSTIFTAKTQNLIVLLLIVALGIFYFATILDGHNWGDDFAIYIMQAKNIAQGTNYSETPFIFNPAFPKWDSHTPPITPLLLSPVYKIFGLNLVAMKAEIAVLFVLHGFYMGFTWVNA